VRFMQTVVRWYRTECFHIIGLSALGLFHSLFTGWLAVAAGLMLCYLSKNPGCYLYRMLIEVKHVFPILSASIGLVAGILDGAVLGTVPTVGTAFLGAFACGALMGWLTERGEERIKWLGFGLMLTMWIVSFLYTYSRIK